MNALPASVERAIRGLKAAAPATALCAYVYDLMQLRAHAAGLIASLPAPCQLYYAIKANPDAPILRTLRPLVHGFEAASLGEIQALRQEDRAVHILYGGPAKTDAAIEGALAAGVERVHVESVHELRRIEAIGARRRDILTQFLLEAISISVAGCIIGVALGVGGAILLNHLTQTLVVITFSSVALGFAVAAAVGIFFGYYPAHRAAGLRPIEALRYQ